ncbi:hypothetical protein [Klebsiella pneumoniae]|uniref:hypothetical protein n=1 Tax=Klebsiella pneumoniae TaxID=573 RepID=UPI001038D805|nr:hypothetical protein [Klebsiella pneumoniae]RZG22409.1 hypothetical protein EXT45_32480 [Klebsiella pneumoniae]
MINAVIAIELEAYLEHDGQIEVVHDRDQPVDGYALYLRYENEQGNALAQWLCDYSEHRWLTQLGTLLATSYHVPLNDYTPHTLAA